MLGAHKEQRKRRFLPANEVKENSHRNQIQQKSFIFTVVPFLLSMLDSFFFSSFLQYSYTFYLKLNFLLFSSAFEKAKLAEIKRRRTQHGKMFRKSNLIQLSYTYAISYTWMLTYEIHACVIRIFDSRINKGAILEGRKQERLKLNNKTFSWRYFENSNKMQGTSWNILSRLRSTNEPKKETKELQKGVHLRNAILSNQIMICLSFSEFRQNMKKFAMYGAAQGKICFCIQYNNITPKDKECFVLCALFASKAAKSHTAPFIGPPTSRLSAWCKMTQLLVVLYSSKINFVLALGMGEEKCARRE